MKRELQDKKRDLLYSSMRLRTLPFRLKNYKKQVEIRSEQNEIYKKLRFFENYEKASRKVVDNVKN